MRLLSSEAEISAALAPLQGKPRLYLDTEFDSSRAGKRLSIIQLSAGGETVLVDALRLASAEALTDLLFQRDVEWVLHAGLQDVELLCAVLQRPPPERLFDTQVAWAFVSAEAGVALAFLQYKLLGVRARKGFQADDWLRRPLPEAQLAYAAEDIAHLPALEAFLRKRLRELARETLLWEVCREALVPAPAPAVKLSFSSFRNAWQLDGRGQHALSALVAWYNAAGAGEQGLIQSRTLLNIAARLPQTRRDLERIKGVSRRLSERVGGALVSICSEASAQAAEGPPLEPPAYARFDEILSEARIALVRANVCAELSIAPELAFPAALTRRLQQCAFDAADLSAPAELLEGWRNTLLAEPWRRHATHLQNWKGELRRNSRETYHG